MVFDKPFWLSLFFAAEWVARLVMLVIVPMRRSPDAAKGWLLLIFFQPTLGLVLYFLIGRPALPAWRRKRRAEFFTLSRPTYQRLAEDPNILHPDLGPMLDHAVRLAESLGDFPILGGNGVSVLSGYEDFIERLTADIDAAHDHVHLMFYIIADDAASAPVTAALARAVARGVNCRVLADALGSGAAYRHFLPRLRALGVQADEAFRLGFFNRAGRIDLRNHRKLVVVDGRIAYTGSQNLVAANFRRGLNYEELNVRLAGPIALALQAVFAEDWYVETEESLLEERYFPAAHIDGTTPAQALPSGPGYPRENNQRLIVSLIHAANQRIVITIPYLVPDESLLQALQTAVLRGVVVTLIVPRQRDQWLVGLAQRSYYDELMTSGVKLVRYGQRFLHAKYVTIDGAIGWVGSSNLDIRSFALNAEIVVLLYDAGVCARLEREQAHYVASGEPLSLDAWRARPAPVKLAENLARLLSPLL